MTLKMEFYLVTAVLPELIGLEQIVAARQFDMRDTATLPTSPPARGYILHVSHSL